MFWLEKDISKVENTMLQWIFRNILENQTFQRIAKLTNFSEMDLMKAIVILVKADEMYNILESASRSLLVGRWDGNEW